MKETTKRFLAFVLAFVMVLGLMPMLSLNASATGEVGDAPDNAGAAAPAEDVTPEGTGSEDDLLVTAGEGDELAIPDPETAAGTGAGTTTTEKTIYKLVSSLTDGEEYLIVNSNSAGNNRYALAASEDGVSVTVKAADALSDAVYIEDKGSALEWTAAASMNNSWQFSSGDYDLGYNSGLVFNEADNWSYNNSRLSTRSGSSNRYLVYGYNGWSASNNNSNVYFYQKTQVEVLTDAEVDGVYSIAGNPAEIKVAVNEDDGTATLGSVLTFTPESGEASTNDTSADADYEIYADPDGIISGIDGNTVTFTGVYGEALIKVSYEVEGAGLVTNYITVVAAETSYITPEDGTDDFPEYPNEGAIRFDKNATAVGNFSQSGMAKVELSMTGVPYSVGNEIDVVIMIDMSDSMKNNNVGRVKPARESAINAIEAIVKNEDGTINNNRVAVYTFNGYDGTGEQNYANAVEEVLALQTYQNANDKTDTSKLTAAQSSINTWIQNNNTDAGTNYGAALEKCYSVLKAAKEAEPDRKQFVIFVTDGEPTTGFAYETANGGVADDGYDTHYQNGAADKYYTYTEYYSKQMRNAGVEVYSIGIQLDNDNANTILRKIGGNSTGTAYANPTTHADYAQFITSNESADKLVDIFEDIVNAIKQAATNVVVEDKIDSHYDVSFDLPNEGVTAAEAGMNEFYIQVLEYQLDADKERTGTPAVLENFTFDANGFLKSHTVDGVVCTDCTHVSFNASGITGLDGTYFDYTRAPATDAEGNYVLDIMGNVVTEEFLTWKADKLTTTELALEYFVYLNNSAGFDLEDQVPADTYPTNEYANITYDNYQDNRVQQEFPVPSMTWNGAQVTYVFYLVNDQGKPVNRAGREIPFAEAVYVTDPVTYDVVWYGDNAKEQLNAEYLAKDLVPEVYALYDINAYYEVDVYQTEGVDEDTDAVNYNHFIIEGSADIENKNTTKVFNTKAGARYDAYGAYANEPGTYVSTNSGTSYVVTDATSMDYANTTVAFAVVWKPELTPDTVVVDFGLDVVIDVATNDTMAAGVVGVRADKPNAEINSGTYKAAKATAADVKLGDMKIGTATLENNTSVRFSLDKDNGMLFSDAAVFYYESDVSFYDKDGDLQTTSMYSSVTVIPATTIYYEDNFVDYSSFTWNYSANGWAEREKSLWTTDGTAVNGTQDEDRPGASKISADLDADNIYGFDGAYSTMNTHSGGSAAKATVNYDNYAQASFEFWGTGFDIISMTSNDTGVILVDVEQEVGGVWDEIDNFMVDTYYGYTYGKCHVRYDFRAIYDENGKLVIDESGEVAGAWSDGAAIHLADECDGSCNIVTELPEDAEIKSDVCMVEDAWVAAPSGQNPIYQVPVIKMADKDYAHYRVTIKATYDGALDHKDPSNETGEYDFYLDAIRIYDPANDGAKNDVIEDAYVADHEGWPSYIELRNVIISAQEYTETKNEDGSVTVTGNDLEGAIFIDGKAENYSITDYVSYGPNNEVYLAPNQSVAFILDTPANLDRVHIGIKSADGTTGTYTIKNVGADGVISNEKSFNVSTATDLYYDLTGWSSDIIVISNTGSKGIISITNIKSTYAPPATEETSIYMTAEAAELVLAAVKPEPVSPFADVQKDQFFYESVLWAVENGITNGVGEAHFGPYMYCSRAQVVTFLWRAAGSPEPVSSVNPFADVKESDFFYKAVLWAVENGITNGLTADTFGANALCNRAQVVTFLWRANGSVVRDAANPFADVADDAFYRDAVIWAVENGITTGVGANAFDPNGTCMRAHVVTFLYRAEQLRAHGEF